MSAVQFTPGVRIFFSHLCKLRAGSVGQSEFAHYWKKKYVKMDDPLCKPNCPGPLMLSEHTL